MGGFTMESKCTGNAELRCDQIVNPGHFVSSGSGVFYIGTGAKFDHGPTHTITLASGAALDFYNNALAGGFNWTVVCEATTSKINFYKSLTFDGNIEIDAGCTCTITASSLAIRMTGDISGAGSLVLVSSTELHLAGNNTYTGTTSGGTVYIASPTAIPDYSKCTSGFGFGLRAGDEGLGLTGAEAVALMTGPLKSTMEATSNKRFCVEDGGIVELDVDIDDWKGAFYNYSNGTVCFTKAVTTKRDMSFYHTGTAGGFRFSNPNGDVSRVGSWPLKQGRLELYNAELYKTNYNFYCISDADKSTWLSISNSHVWCENKNNGASNIGPFRMGNGARTKDVLEILEGSGVTNSVHVGAAAGSTAAIYHRGGAFTILKDGGGDSMIGESGVGFLETSGGQGCVYYHCQLGRYAGSVGLHYMTGGTFTVPYSAYNIGQSGDAAFYLSGGSFTCTPLFYIGSSAYDKSCVNPESQWHKHTWTLEGEGTVATCSNGIRMSERNNTEDTINLNDGARLTTKFIQRSRAEKDNNATCLPDGGFYTNDNPYVNFNGGIFASTDASYFSGDGTWTGRGTTSRRPKVTVYPKGGTIVVPMYSGLKTSLEAPVGMGVTAIPMPENAVTTGLIAPPYVNITGDGTNATAVATFDSKTGTWTGIKITSPGFGYTWAKANIGPGLYEVDCTVGDVSGGGMRFDITGELHIDVACTYTGPTRVSGGRLWFNGGSIASREIIVDAGANICVDSNFNGANIHGSGDVYYNWHTASFTADANEAGVAQASQTLTIDANPVFTIRNWSGSDQVITVLRKNGGAIAGTANLANATFAGETIPEDFRVRARYVNGAVTVSIREIKGMLMIVR